MENQRFIQTALIVKYFERNNHSKLYAQRYFIQNNSHNFALILNPIKIRKESRENSKNRKTRYMYYNLASGRLEKGTVRTRGINRWNQEVSYPINLVRNTRYYYIIFSTDRNAIWINLCIVNIIYIFQEITRDSEF